MEYYNALEIIFDSHKEAMSMKDCIYHSLDGEDAKAYGYSEKWDFSDIIRNSIKFDDNNTYYIKEDDECGFATPEDSITLLEIMAKALVECDKNCIFHINGYTTGSYSEAEIRIVFKDHRLLIESTYFPEGYVESLECPECGEEIVSLDDYEVGKTYVCPGCGEALELDDEYEEIKPVKSSKTIDV